MSVSYEDKVSQLSLLLCISIALVVVLLCYISKQDYNTACGRGIMDLHYRAHISEGDYPARALSKYQSINKKESMENTCGTMLEKHKKTVEPEKEVMTEHYLGDSLHGQRQKMDDPLSLDPFADLKSSETTDQRLHRNLSTADYDGPQLEGMSTPVSSFEDDALSRQMVKNQEVYGEQYFTQSEAKQLLHRNL